MAGVTTAIVALGGLGMSAAQYASANKANKAAQQAAKQAMVDLKSINEVNPYKETQVPTLGFDLAQQQMIQQQTAALDYAKSMGASGAGLVSGITETGNAQSLKLAGLANQAEYERDTNIATAQSGINQRAASREYNIGLTQLEGAQEASLEARRQKQAAIKGAFSSLTTAANAVDLSAYGNTKGNSVDPSGLSGGDFGGSNMPTNDPIMQILAEDQELYDMSAQVVKNSGRLSFQDWAFKNPTLSVDELKAGYKEYAIGGF